MKKLVILLFVLALGGCTMNLEDVKDNAPTELAAMGYNVVAYEGYQFGVLGAKVWYIVEQHNSPVRYNLYMQKWGDEYHLYNIHPLGGLNTNHSGDVRVQ